MTKSPNILFLQVDQLFATALSAYGGPAITPNLDRLANMGVVFENAYCNYPLCAPSRASMATGKLCSEIGAYDNAGELPASIPTYAHYLRDLGYQTALSGKMHFIGPDQHHGFEERLTPDLYPTDFAWVPNWGDEGERDTNDPRSVTISGVTRRSVQMDFDEEVTQKAKRHLFDIARSNDERPFFLQVSWTHPHEPYLCTQEFWDLYDGDDIPPPAVPPLTPDQHDPHSTRLLKDFGMFEYNFAAEDVARARRAYFGAVSYIDRMVGDLLATLETAGLAENTAIIFTSDHGDMLGERGMWFKKHFFDPSLKVPLLLFAPWIKPQRIRELTSLIDLLPTFAGLAAGSGWKCDIEKLDGIDLTTLIDNGNPAPTRDVFAEYLGEATNAPIFMMRRGALKLIVSQNDPPLLFDLDADPLELKNVANRAEYVEQFADMRQTAEGKWDADQITRDIRTSQKRRQLVRSAQSKGRPERWNHELWLNLVFAWFECWRCICLDCFCKNPIRPKKDAPPWTRLTSLNLPVERLALIR